MVTTIEGAMLSRRSRIDRKSHQQSTGSQLLLIYFWVRDKHTENIIYIKALFHRTCSCQIQTSRTGSNLLKVHFLGDEAVCVGGTQDVQLWSKISNQPPPGLSPISSRFESMWNLKQQVQRPSNYLQKHPRDHIQQNPMGDQGGAIGLSHTPGLEARSSTSSRHTWRRQNCDKSPKAPHC